MKKITLLAVAVLLTQVACVTVPEYSRDEYLNLTTHEFPGKTAEEVIVAAEQVLRLADPKDVNFTYKPEDQGLIGYRSWFAYMVIAAAGGTYSFDLTTKDTESGAKAYLAISANSKSITPSGAVGLDGGVGLAADSSSTPTAPLNSFHMPTYQLFWSRMDYVLGLSPEWYTCDRFSSEVSKFTHSMCEMASDELPKFAKGSVPPSVCREWRDKLSSIKGSTVKAIGDRNGMRVKISTFCTKEVS